MDTDQAAYTIDEFCAAHAISRATYYRLKSDGKAPALMRVRSEVRISCEAAAAWRRAREAEAAAA